MNFLSGAIGAQGFTTEDGLTLPLADNFAANSGRSAVYGIRPEHLIIDDSGLPFVVDVVEPTGSETQVQGKLGRQLISGVFRQRVDAKPGETIRIAPELGAVHLFDAQSTERMSP